ncbi:MAG: hypothetical protein ACI8RZ_006752 [Myxococcota bacterium]|jgi:hypothetical protein
MRLTIPIVATSLILALACGGGESGISSSVDDFSATVDVPAQVSAGETFELTVTVYNTAPQEQTLYSLDLADEFMAGTEVVGSDPPYGSYMHVPIDNTESYEYMTPIPSGGSTTVKLTMLATDAGSWSGEVDVCVDGNARYNSYMMSTNVQ